MKLLLVDDEEVSIEAILSGVNWENCQIDQVFGATMVTDAKKIYTEEHPDILVLDIEMPGENGLEFLAWVRAVEEKRTACIFLTCHPDFNYAVNAIHLHADNYVLKPVEYVKLETILLELVLTLKNDLMDEKLREYGSDWLEKKAKDTEGFVAKPLDGRAVVEDTAAFIRQNLSEKLLREDLAKRVYLNPDYLNRLFKRYKNMSINKFIIKERMELAGYLLKEKGLPATRVALETGYPNYANFVSAFNKYFAVNPSEYCKK